MPIWTFTKRFDLMRNPGPIWRDDVCQFTPHVTLKRLWFENAPKLLLLTFCFNANHLPNSHLRYHSNQSFPLSISDFSLSHVPWSYYSMDRKTNNPCTMSQTCKHSGCMVRQTDTNTDTGRQSQEHLVWDPSRKITLVVKWHIIWRQLSFPKAIWILHGYIVLIMQNRPVFTTRKKKAFVVYFQSLYNAANPIYVCNL